MLRRRERDSELTLAIKQVLANSDRPLSAYEIFECLPPTSKVYSLEHVRMQLSAWRTRGCSNIRAHAIGGRCHRGQRVRWRYELT